MSGGTLDVTRVLRGTRIVVLGGTGFLGKLFWSMLLDRYPSVGAVYLVVRTKEGGAAAAASRFAGEIAVSEALEPLRRAHGAGYLSFLNGKVVPIDGDMGRPRCGLPDDLVDELRGTIDAVVNVAGVVDFNPSLDEALDANAFGAQNVVSLARALGDVPVLHTSTCYVAGTRKGPIVEDDPRAVPFPRAGVLGTELWDPNREIAECLDLVAQAKHRSDDAFRQSEFSERARNRLIARGEPTRGEAYESEFAAAKRAFVRDRLIEAGLDRAIHWGWPNIYTYTKAIGEQVVAGSGLRFTIARPAACESTMAFPEPAYNEGINTSAPLIYLIMKGEPQILGGQVPLDLIPADYVVAGMILALAELLEGTAKPVYHYGAADVNPCTVQRFGELVGIYKRNYYRSKGSGKLLFDALQARYEPSFVGRARFERTGAPARAAAGHRIASFIRRAMPPFAPVAAALEHAARRDAKIAEIQRLFEPFTSKMIGPFDCSNTRAAHARLSDEDRRRLPWAPESIDWAEWMMNVHMPAMERRILPEMDRRLKKEIKPLRAHLTVPAMIDELANLHGAAPALQRPTAAGLTRVSFRDVQRGAQAVAARLARRGIGKGDRVVISARNDPNWAIAYFGILRAGATAVLVDPALDQTGWRSVLAESRARAVVWDEAARAKEAVAAEHPSVVPFDLHDAVEPTAALEPPPATVEPGDIASIVFTSGTTGRPKGVMLTHANFTSLVAALAPIFPLGAGDVVLSVLPLHHTFELTCGLLLPLSRGARVVYVGDPTVERIAGGLRACRPTAMVGAPAVWQLLERRILERIDARGALARAAFDTAVDVNRWLGSRLGIRAGRLLFGAVHAELGGRVRWLISGGAALPRETQERFAGLGFALTQGYGLAEASPLLAASRPEERAGAGVGSAIPGVQLKIDRPDVHGVGEVLARGPGVMAGYTDPRATPNPIDAAGWLHTGDLGRLGARGQLEIVGRAPGVVSVAEPARAGETLRRPPAAPERRRARRSDPQMVLPAPVRTIGKALVGRAQDVFYGEVMKAAVHGRAHVPHNRNVIVIANHASHLDTGLVRHALGTYGRGIVSLAAEDSFFERGVKRAFVENLTNVQPIDRHAPLRQSIRQAAEVIARGETVLLFPEGARSVTGEMGAFRPLIGHLALVHRVDILPIYLQGTHAALPKGTALPIRREIVARIGPALCVLDLRRLTEGMPLARASREVARLAQAAVAALRDGRVLDLGRVAGSDEVSSERENPLVGLFSELEAKFRAGEVERPVSYYVTLGSDALAKWTVRIDSRACDVRPGRPEGGQADCVLKTTPELFAKIVRESYVPSPADFLSGAIKSNDVTLLTTFQKVFQLDQAS